MKVVVDTSAWYAFVVATDDCHRAAANFLQADLELIIPYSVLEEVLALVQSRFGKEKAIESGKRINEYGILSLTKTDLRVSWKMFLESPAAVSYVDCTVAAVAKRLNQSVFGFDPHFEKLGIKQVP